ncbi:LysE family translocator [Nocardioides sp. cx-173]|uniref:LysE family translocator n=1 Tax=Nocardioides sp. cx-173 TaxID=2898796 RepID=UPI001E338217|nr:LysE family translocator [Nocardioides sp. cx-173]MCD4526774.1 LysE family translocator [Nocardioides sp. cx-173]UGB43880.1 LysE family translocator [Nocardioides sp. cx-173]
MELAAPTPSQWLAFAVASILFIQVPGPSLLFTIGRALTVGRRDALLSVVGNAAGIVAQVVAVAWGLGAVVAASATAYTAIKLAGAGYVVWLGVQAIRHRADARTALGAVDEEARALARGQSARRSLRIGFLVGLTNPKTVVFFVAFLPHFVNDAAGHTRLQLLMLGAVFGALCVASDSLWALAAGKARDWFGRRPERLDALGVAGGTMMVGLGVSMAAVE